MATIVINDNLLKNIKEIAKKENVTKETLITESLEKLIEEREIIEENLKYPDGIPLEVVAEEFGETTEEFIEKLEEAEAEFEAGGGIELTMEELRERLEVDHS